jgi:hypothetical protein
VKTDIIVEIEEKPIPEQNKFTAISNL